MRASAVVQQLRLSLARRWPGRGTEAHVCCRIPLLSSRMRNCSCVPGKDRGCRNASLVTANHDADRRGCHQNARLRQAADRFA